MDYRIQQLRFQLREDPASRYFFQLGELLRKQGELDEAAEILEKGLEIHPRYVAAWVALGRTRHSAGDLAAAEAAFARALELDPEHGVAARLIGETAVARGDELRAVTAFKLARALLGPDQDLEDRIADLETRTLPLEDAPVAEATPDEGTATEASPTSVETASSGDDADPFALEPEDSWKPRPGLADVIAVEQDDPFAVTNTGQTGVFVLGEDVFTDLPNEAATTQTVAEVLSEEAAPEDPFADAGGEPPSDELAVPPEPGATEDEDLFAVSEPPSDHSDEFLDIPEMPESDPEPEIEVLEESPEPVLTEHTTEMVETPVAPSVLETEYPAVEIAPEPEQEPTADFGDGLPVPTLTLARLAWEQDDLALAERTLEALLEKNPVDAEAADFLELVRNRPRIPEPESLPSSVPPASTVDALQGWLQRFRLAAERSRP